MKVSKVTVVIHNGLPQYSHKSATVEVVADEGESLGIEGTIAMVRDSVELGWNDRFLSGQQPKEEKEVPVRKLRSLKAKDLINDEDLEG